MQTFQQTTLKRFILFYKVDQSAKNRVLLEQAISIQKNFRLNQLAKKNSISVIQLMKFPNISNFHRTNQFSKNSNFSEQAI